MNKSSLAKKRKLTYSLTDRQRSSSLVSESSTEQKVFFKQASNWNLEQNYESKPRKTRRIENESSKLPIITADGLIQEATRAESIGNSDSDSEYQETCQPEAETESFTTQHIIPIRKKVLEAQEELAKIALLLRDNDPEEHVGALKTLAKFGQSPNSTIKKLSFMTQLAVYKDLIPGYRIRQLTKEDMATKVSKEVKKTRAYEQELVAGYQQYVRELSKLAQLGKSSATEGNGPSLASIAISCTCTLLISVPHFNFRGELVKILVGVLSSQKVDGDFVKCCETLMKLFQQDDDGAPSLDVVTNLTKMMKEKGYRIHEIVLNLFLHLRLLSDFSCKGSTVYVDKPKKDEYFGKKPLRKKEFRTKKERKYMRERKSVELEMKAAELTISHQEKNRMQAETLKRVFLTYFRILKLRSPTLMGAALEGLARYAHLINQDFFGDLLEVLKELVGHVELQTDIEQNEAEDEQKSSNVTRQALLCVVTAFALLQGQDASKSQASLNLDLSFFVTYLYNTIHTLCLNPDIELCNRLSPIFKPIEVSSPPLPAQKINFETTTVLLLQSVSSILMPSVAARAVPPLRIAAFVKQLLTSCLQLPEKSCISVISLMRKVIKIHGRKISSLWDTEERRGDGIFDAFSNEVDGSNPFAATIWEGELLKKHFSPIVRDSVKCMEKIVLELKQL